MIKKLALGLLLLLGLAGCAAKPKPAVLKLSAASQTIAAPTTHSQPAAAQFWDLPLAVQTAPTYQKMQARFGSPSRLLGVVKNGRLKTGIAQWTNFAHTNQRLTLLFQNGQLAAKLVDRITVKRASSPSVFAVDFYLRSADYQNLATKFGGYNLLAGARGAVLAQFQGGPMMPVQSFNYTFGYTGLTGKTNHAYLATYNREAGGVDDFTTDQPVAHQKLKREQLAKTWFTQLAKQMRKQFATGKFTQQQIVQGQTGLTKLQ